MREFKLEGTRYYLLTWDDVEEDVEKLSRRIEEKFGMPTIIFGILRGGATVANLLSDRLRMHNVHSVGTKSYKDIAERGELDLYQPITVVDLSRHHVALVDDVSDTGDTLKDVLSSQIKPRNPRRLCTATLHIKPWTGFVPDFFVKELDGWIVYPWEKHETIRSLGEKLVKKYDLKKAQDVIVKEFGYKSSIVKRILKTRSH